ncbi:MAG: MBL fold metallo-hydrolase [Thermoprotei archaeon]|nr:MAG: MBL fold metallo-hydrolase [Thermoprotei archaeon]
MQNIWKNVYVETHTSRYSSNTYIIDNEDEVIVIDPGFKDLSDSLIKFLASHRKINIIHTHMHYDHIAATTVLRKMFKEKVKVYHHILESEYLEKGDSIYTLATLFGDHIEPITVNEKIKEGEIVSIKTPLRVIHTPGHTIGSICIIYEKIVFTGDTLFSNGQVGASNLPTGNRLDLMSSLLKLEKIEGEIIAPGHGPVAFHPLKELVKEALLLLGP